MRGRRDGAGSSRAARGAQDVRGGHEARPDPEGPQALDDEAGVGDRVAGVAREVRTAAKARGQTTLRSRRALSATDRSARGDDVLVEAQLAAGRSTRWSSASAAAWSGTEQSTRHATATSIDSSCAGKAIGGGVHDGHGDARRRGGPIACRADRAPARRRRPRRRPPGTGRSGARAGAELQHPAAHPAEQLAPVLADLGGLLAGHHRAHPREEGVTDLGSLRGHQPRLYRRRARRIPAGTAPARALLPVAGQRRRPSRRAGRRRARAPARPRPARTRARRPRGWARAAARSRSASPRRTARCRSRSAASC